MFLEHLNDYYVEFKLLAITKSVSVFLITDLKCNDIRWSDLISQNKKIMTDLRIKLTWILVSTHNFGYNIVADLSITILGK